MHHHENRCDAGGHCYVRLGKSQASFIRPSKNRHPRPRHCTSSLCECHGTTPQTFADRFAFASKMWAQCWPTSDREE